VTTGEPYYETQGSTDLPPTYGQDDTNAGSSTTQQIADKARQSADQVKQAASSATDQVKQTTMSQAASQKDQAAQSLNTVGQAVNQAAQQLRQNNQAPIAQVAETAASNINQLADYLRTRNVNDLIGEVESFASRQPALFLGGAFLVGVLGARFLKSSRSGMSQQGSSAGAQQWRGQGQQRWSAAPTGYTGYTTQTGRYGNQYAPYNSRDMPGTGDNVNTGGLAFGSNPPTGRTADSATGARRADGTFETYPTDDNIIAGETPS
jgi:hypothetical protein